MRPMNVKMKRIFALVLALMLLSTSALATTKALVFGTSMPVFFGPSRAAEKISTLKPGTTVQVDAVSGGWARINYNGLVGFAQIENMLSLQTVRARITKLTPIVYITTNNTTPRMGTLDRNTTVYIRSIKGDKVLVSNADMSILAYVPANCVR